MKNGRKLYFEKECWDKKSETEKDIDLNSAESNREWDKKRNHHLWNTLIYFISFVCTLGIVYDDDRDN